MKMTQEELRAKLDAHKLWLATRYSSKPEGERLDLRDADLADADLAGADLFGADLFGADLTRADLAGANLTRANLRDADLTRVNLAGANLFGAYLDGAYLFGADLDGANLADADLARANLARSNLSGANFDYSAWPLSCGSLNVKIDKRLAAQLMYHTMRVMLSCKDDASVAAVLARPECVTLANQFHRVDECGRLEVLSGESKADER